MLFRSGGERTDRWERDGLDECDAVEVDVWDENAGEPLTCAAPKPSTRDESIGRCRGSGWSGTRGRRWAFGSERAGQRQTRKCERTRQACTAPPQRPRASNARDLFTLLLPNSLTVTAFPTCESYEKFLRRTPLVGALQVNLHSMPATSSKAQGPRPAHTYRRKHAPAHPSHEPDHHQASILL